MVWINVLSDSRAIGSVFALRAGLVLQLALGRRPPCFRVLFLRVIDCQRGRSGYVYAEREGYVPEPIVLWTVIIDPDGRRDAKASVVLMKFLRARCVPQTAISFEESANEMCISFQET